MKRRFLKIGLVGLLAGLAVAGAILLALRLQAGMERGKLEGNNLPAVPAGFVELAHEWRATYWNVTVVLPRETMPSEDLKRLREAWADYPYPVRVELCTRPEGVLRIEYPDAAMCVGSVWLNVGDGGD